MTTSDLEKDRSIFKSFWMGGFESSTHINRYGTRLDLIAFTQHDEQVQVDYALLRAMGLSVVRDAARWHLIEKTPGKFDFSSFLPMIKAARLHQVQVIWDICHYGFPNDIDLLSPSFVTRFSNYAAALAQVVKDQSPDIPFYCPFNEISFYSWAAGEEGWIHPFYRKRGADVKQQLVRSCIAAVNAIWEVDPRARIVYVDPIIHVHPPADKPELANDAIRYTESQYEALDMFLGRAHPELGGDPRYLDIIGVNFYHSNQWEHGVGRLRWEDEPRDSRWIPLHKMLETIYRRYERPLFIAETSHVGVGRARWMNEIGAEVLLAFEAGVPLQGVCLYPIIDRPDWEDDTHWHNSGLWDYARENGKFIRVLNSEYEEALRNAQLQVYDYLRQR